MKARCKDCIYFADGHDGDYGEGGYYCDCNHPLKSKKHDVDDKLYFPFYPAPGCFVPNELLAPKRFEPKGFLHSNDNFYVWLGIIRDKLRMWSGDAIEISE